MKPGMLIGYGLILENKVEQRQVLLKKCKHCGFESNLVGIPFGDIPQVCGLCTMPLIDEDDATETEKG